MAQSNLIGFARKSKNGNSIRIELSKPAFLEAETYQSRDGHEFVSLVLNLNKLHEIMTGDREVTTVVQFVE